MLLDLLGLEQPSALPAEEPPPRAQRSRSFIEDALPLAVLLLSSVGNLTDELSPRAPSLRARVIEDAGPLDATVAAALAPFIDEERPRRAPAAPSRFSDTFPEKPNQPAIATFLSEEERAARQLWRTVRSADAFPETRLLAPFLDVDGAARGPWRPARLGLDTFPEKRALGPQLADEGPFRGPWRSARAADTFPESRVLAPFLGEERAVASVWRNGRSALDTFPEKRLLAPFLDEAGVVRVARQAARLEDVGPVAALDQNDVVSFLDDERTPKAPRSIARATDTFPEKKILAPFLDETRTIRVVQRAAQADDAGPIGPLDQNDVASFLSDEHLAPPPRQVARSTDTFPESRVLAPFLADERAVASVWRTGRSALDTFPEKRLLAPFLDEAGVLRLARPAARPDDAAPVTALDQNDVVSFLDDELPPKAPRSIGRAADAFPETRLLAPFLDVDGAARGPWRPARLGLDTFPEKPVLSPHLADEGPFKGPWRPARAADTFPESRVLAPFLADERAVASVWRTGGRAFDTFPETRVLAPFLGEDAVIPVTRKTTHPEDADPGRSLDEYELVSYFGVEIELPRPRVARAFGAEDPLILPALVPTLYPFLGEEGLPPKDPHPDAYTDDTAAIGPVQLPDLAPFCDTEFASAPAFRLRAQPQDALPETCWEPPPDPSLPCMSYQGFPPSLLILSPRLTVAGNPSASVVGLNTTPLSDGSFVYCLANRFEYQLDKQDNTTVPDGVDVLAPLTGPGRWFKRLPIAAGTGAPLSRQKFIDGDTTQTGLDGSIADPFKTIAQFMASRADASVPDATAAYVGWVMPSLAGYVEATVAFPAYVSTELRADSYSDSSSGTSITGNLTWVNRAGANAGNSPVATVHNISVSGSFTVTDDVGAPTSRVIFGGDEFGDVDVSLAGGFVSNTTTNLTNVVFTNAVVGGIDAGATTDRAVVLLFNSLCSGAVTAQSLDALDAEFFGSAITVFASAFFHDCAFGAPVTLTAPGGATFDGSSWISFLGNGGTRAVGTAVLVEGGYSGGGGNGANLLADGSTTGVSLNGTGASVGYSGENSGNHYKIVGLSFGGGAVVLQTGGGEKPGDTILITKPDFAAQAYAVKNNAAVTIATIPTLSQGFVLARFDGSDWVFEQGGFLLA